MIDGVTVTYRSKEVPTRTGSMTLLYKNHTFYSYTDCVFNIDRAAMGITGPLTFESYNGEIRNDNAVDVLSRDWLIGNDEFVNNFKRVEGWVEACENPSTIPAASKPSEPVHIDEDELPF